MRNCGLSFVQCSYVGKTWIIFIQQPQFDKSTEETYLTLMCTPDDRSSHKGAKCGVHQQGHACSHILEV